MKSSLKKKYEIVIFYKGKQVFWAYYVCSLKQAGRVIKRYLKENRCSKEDTSAKIFEDGTRNATQVL